jgi:hypothetical protein
MGALGFLLEHACLAWGDSAGRVRQTVSCRGLRPGPRDGVTAHTHAQRTPFRGGGYTLPDTGFVPAFSLDGGRWKVLVIACIAVDLSENYPVHCALVD